MSSAHLQPHWGGAGPGRAGPGEHPPNPPGTGLQDLDSIPEPPQVVGGGQADVRGAGVVESLKRGRTPSSGDPPAGQRGPNPTGTWGRPEWTQEPWR